MRLFAGLLALALSARAAVLQGFVLESESGRPLARTSVTLTPLPGWTGLKVLTTRTESNGSFFFGAPPGAYLLSLQREGFATYRQGAKCGMCPGAALLLNGDERTVLDIRMRRLGAVTGTLVDENQVGLPGIPVLVYTATRPLQQVGKTVSDDRGFFRVGGLAPGSYVVRTAATKLDDGSSYLSTFYPEGTDMQQVRPVPVDLDRTWANVDFGPIPGKLFRVQGKLIMPAAGFTNVIDLISDSGRLHANVDALGNFLFENVGPGNYEVFAEGKGVPGHFAAWQMLVVERDTEVIAPMVQALTLHTSLMDQQRKRLMKNEVKVTMRRKDLDKEGPEIPIPLTPMTIAPGDWEVHVITGDDFYATEVRIAGKRTEMRSKWSAEGWVAGQIPMNGLPPDNGVAMSAAVSSRVASLTGKVTDRTNEVAPYAPILLETMNLEPPDPLLLREARAGSDGSFTFDGLPPGRYRILASYDLDWSDRAGIDTARPLELTLKDGEKLNQDLSIYHKP
jgi:hypothetical protein